MAITSNYVILSPHFSTQSLLIPWILEGEGLAEGGKQAEAGGTQAWSSKPERLKQVQTENLSVWQSRMLWDWKKGYLGSTRNAMGNLGRDLWVVELWPVGLQRGFNTVGIAAFHHLSLTAESMFWAGSVTSWKLQDSTCFSCSFDGPSKSLQTAII